MCNQWDTTNNDVKKMARKAMGAVTGGAIGACAIGSATPDDKPERVVELGLRAQVAVFPVRRCRRDVSKPR